MPKDFSLTNLVRDLDYTVNGTYVHEFLFRVCPPRPGRTVLELGCGSGKFGLSYALRGARVTLIDIDPEVIDYCTRLRRSLEALLKQTLPVLIQEFDFFKLKQLLPVAVEQLAFFKANFVPADLVMNEGVPQHFPDEDRRQACIDLMSQLAQGKVVVIGNNGLNPREQEIDRTFSFTYQGMPPTRKCFTPDELKTRMEMAGLREVRVEPLGGALTDATLIAGWGVK